MPRLATLLAFFCALVLGLAACGGDDDQEGEATPAPAAESTAAPEAEQAGCRKVPAPEAKDVGRIKKPTLELAPGKDYVAVVTTSCGAFEITLDPKNAPKTGGSFVHLARQGFYDGLGFHRIIAGFVIQGGDPEGTGQGGPGYSVIEAPPKNLQYTKGVVAMAKTQVEEAGTSGSQFFVVTGEDAALPADYALLGRVTKGQEVVDAIGVVQTGPGDAPVDPVIIESIEIRES